MNEYVKMCDTPEVQEKWEPRTGDRYFDKRYEGAGIDILREYCPRIGAEPRKYLIFLPRQEDIQGWWMEDKDKNDYTLFREFRAYLSNDMIPEKNDEYVACDFTEEWLIFYMRSVHSLYWTGEEWKEIK